MAISTRTGQKGEYTDVILKRLSMGRPLSRVEKEKLEKDREKFKRALQSE